MSFGEFLKREREKQNISAYRIAKEVGISRTTILAYEKGEIEPTIKNAEKICRYLKVKYVIGK